MAAATDMYSVKPNDMVGPKAATEPTALTTKRFFSLKDRLASQRCDNPLFGKSPLIFQEQESRTP